jgi:POT family proton-dependent oligopeptide transporter
MAIAATEKPATLFGHPKGFAVIAGTEFWDRVSFHGMQALLVLYMVGALLKPGHVEHVVGFAQVRAAIEWFRGPLSVKALATQLFGLYVGLVWLTPALGGVLGDRVLGRRRAVALGALLMTAGHFAMAFDQSFFLALLLLILGAGLLRGNLAPQIGALYAKEDRRRMIAFQLYGSAVNLGAFVAPLVTGELEKDWGWHIAFAFAGFGMLAGLVVYLLGARTLPQDQPRAAAHAAAPLEARERRAVMLLLLLVPVAALFWIAQSQVWNTYNLWVQDHVRLQFGSWTMPVPWLQSLDGISPFLFLPLFLAVWRWQARRGREPGEMAKCAIGCFIFAAATLLLSLAQYTAGPDGRATLVLPVLFHLSSNIGWLFFSPTIVGLYSRVAPDRLSATMVGVYFTSVFIGSTVSGWLGGLYETLSPSAFWALHAGLCALGGILFLLFGSFMRRTIAPA